MESQTKQILSYLKTGKSITALDALKMFNCFRLAARIADIRNDYNIKTEFSKGKKRYAIYSLIN